MIAVQRWVGDVQRRERALREAIGEFVDAHGRLPGLAWFEEPSDPLDPEQRVSVTVGDTAPPGHRWVLVVAGELTLAEFEEYRRGRQNRAVGLSVVSS